MRDENICKLSAKVTRIIDCGISLDIIFFGKIAISPQGLRLDILFEGILEGKLAGRVSGVDYIRIRADGRVDLDIRAVIETNDNHRIAFSATGVAKPHSSEPVAEIYENITLLTAAEKYNWVNTQQIWGTGLINFIAGKIDVNMYA